MHFRAIHSRKFANLLMMSSDDALTPANFSFVFSTILFSEIFS